MFDWKELNPSVVEEFRANGGKVAQFGDLPVVVLHTLGARSGKLREVPLIVVIDADALLLFASSAGSKKQPDWVFNLRANPRITVEYGTETFIANLVELPEPERQAKVREQAKRTPQFADYVASAAPREIPVFSIERI